MNDKGVSLVPIGPPVLPFRADNIAVFVGDRAVAIVTVESVRKVLRDIDERYSEQREGDDVR